MANTNSEQQLKRIINGLVRHIDKFICLSNFLRNFFVSPFFFIRIDER